MPRLRRPEPQHPGPHTTITALQALALLNDLFMVKQSQYFARRLEAVTTTPPTVESAYPWRWAVRRALQDHDAS